MALIGRGRLVVVSLSILWIIVTVWQEYLQFSFDGDKCQWPDHKFKPAADENADIRPEHVLIIADPQILDHRSYPGRGAFLTWLSRIIVDLNLRKNWWAATRKEPDAVVFLGDMMDGGRFDMSDEEYVVIPPFIPMRVYEAYFQRFKSIFKLDPTIPQYFIPGNHDTGLGFSQTFSPYTHLRYTTHFGPKNYVVQLANHTLAFIDAPGFVDEEYKRLGTSKTYDNWKPLSGGTLEFMKKFNKEEHTDPVVLFTHVPLYRPDGRGCGPLRERGTIRPGVGNGYQNTLGKQSSQKLLELLTPSLIFSGDDHDYCEHTHRVSTTGSQPGGAPRDIREVTVKSLSMAMGIKRPGFQLLSLAPTALRRPSSDSSTEPITAADAPCLLPNQLHTYLGIYIPLGILSLVLIAASQFFVGFRTAKHNLKHSVDLSSGYYDGQDSDSLTTNGNGRGMFRLTPTTPTFLRTRRDGAEADLESNIPSSSPSPGPSSPAPSAEKGWYSHTPARGPLTRVLRHAQRLLSLLGSSARHHHPGRRRRCSRLAGFLYDARDVAVWPIGLFIVITWWFS